MAIAHGRFDKEIPLRLTFWVDGPEDATARFVITGRGMRTIRTKWLRASEPLALRLSPPLPRVLSVKCRFFSKSASAIDVAIIGDPLIFLGDYLTVRVPQRIRVGALQGRTCAFRFVSTRVIDARRLAYQALTPTKLDTYTKLDISLSDFHSERFVDVSDYRGWSLTLHPQYSYPVWFGTNRKAVIAEGGRIGFSAERDGRVHYGMCRIDIPKSHQIGSLGSSFWRRLLSGINDRLAMQDTIELSSEAYWVFIASTLGHVDIAERDAVVFLHGYNVAFDDAALRAAQLGFDLGIAGVMAFYSWLSKGALDSYPADEASIEASEGFITDFLIDMSQLSGASKVHIIAHSMGNRALLRAMTRIAETVAEKSGKLFNQIIIAAVDVDQDTFRRLSAAYSRVADRTTMYVCSKDRAVGASHWLHEYPRAGLVLPVLVVPGIDTINVSNLDLTTLGYGYVAEARELLTDIHMLLKHGSAPSERFGLRQESSPDGMYWVVGK